MGILKLRKKGLLNRFKRLTKPTGKPQWSQAMRTFILMIIAGLLATILKFNNGIEAIMMVTLLATLIIDISLPIKKVAILALLGFIMTTLAFLSVSLSISYLPAFIFFTIIWAFFSISMYIFGSMEGTLGFSFFLTYFVAVLIVNPSSTTVEWISYTTLAYLVASILFIPKLWVERRRIRELVSVGFNPGSTIQNVLCTIHILSGISLNSINYDFFKFGGYLKILRNYGGLLTSRLGPEQNKYLNEYLEVSDDVSKKIGENFKEGKGSVDEKNLKIYLSKIEAATIRGGDDTALLISNNIQRILDYCNLLLSRNPGKEFKTIPTNDKSFKEVINANFNLENLYIRHAIRFTLAMTIGLIFIYITRDRSAIWITMGILIIIKPDITSTMDNLIQRVGSNFIAILLAILLAIIFPHYVLIWLAVIMLFLFRAFYPTYMGFSVMAMTVFIVLVWPTGTVYDNAVARIVDICVGGIIAFICAYVILPNRVTINLPEQFSKTVGASAEYGIEIMANSDKNINKKSVSDDLKNYILQENNLEAGIKKLEDTFRDINEDLSLYQNLISLNAKLTADLTALAALLIQNPEQYSQREAQLKSFEKSLDKLRKPTKIVKSQELVHDIYLRVDEDNTDEIGHLLNWIYSDIQLLSKGFEMAHGTDLFTRYTRLT